MIKPQVQRMIDNPGIYVCSTQSYREHGVIIASIEGKLIVMKMDAELDPARFADDLVISHGPLKP